MSSSTRFQAVLRVFKLNYRLTNLIFVLLLTCNFALAEEDVNFQQDIRPILSDKCFHCHGPAEEDREADLRLDVAESALGSAIVAGLPDKSEVFARITSDDSDSVMPPLDSGKSLTAEEIELLRRWIAQGARYEEHWAFVAPQRPAVPVEDHWVRNPIDGFVLDRLNRVRLSPSPEANRATWLRRLSLDLTGLPPSIAEVDAFLADDSLRAYESQIDRLLQSKHFGERWARIWLDAARYADSNGYEKDAPREMWFYRDWVIDAFNTDMPFDEFVIKQIAGDLLAEPNQQNLVATGFLRNSMVNEEGGADPEQFRMEAMFDRMDAIGKSVLGLTVQCAQCHSHKYDPMTHEDYYKMFAFINNTHDAIVPVYAPEQQVKIEGIQQQIAEIEDELRLSMQPKEVSIPPVPNKWEVLEPIDLPYEGTKYTVLPDSSILSQSYAPKSSAPQFSVETKTQNITAVRIELLTHPLLPRRGPGRSQRGTAALSEVAVYVAPIDQPDKKTRIEIISATADVNPTKTPQPEYLRDIKAKKGDKRTTGPIAFAIDKDKSTAWTTDLDPGRRNQSRNAVFVLEKPVGFEHGTRITIQPTMSHGGWNNNDNHNCLMGRWRFSLSTDEAPIADPVPALIRKILETPAAEQTAEQKRVVFSYWRTTVDEWAKENAAIESLWRQYPEGTTQLVLEELQSPRRSSILDRGDFLSPTQQVTPGVPGFLHSLPEDADDSRLTYAKWLVDRKSPTTARSIVNRIWQAYFGIGLVETSDDLGSQSTPPSHPKLLDWLAVELMENDWQLKHIHKLIVSSATYRQTSNVSKDLQQRDPYNRLLARGPRFRVDAEIVRDIMLTSSGLLNRDVGGPSVYPPAPDFLFQPPASYGPKTWAEDTDKDRYRRGLYTFRFRSVPYPMMEAFDAVPGNVSCVRRNRSNTPLQALTSLNEPLSIECARALATKVLKEGGNTDQARLAFAVRQCVSRFPEPEELTTLRRLLDEQMKRLNAKEIDAAKILGVPSTSPDQNKQAAWTLVARVLLSLDETITKE